MWAEIFDCFDNSGRNGKGEMGMQGFRSLIAILSVAAAVGFAGAASAVPFQPVIDEFWVIRNSTENFRDSFSDGVKPPSGPEDGLTSSGNTYGVSGAAGFTSESGGKLTMTPELGVPTLISSGLADTFVGARRLRSTNPASSAFLGLGQSFEIHGLFDLSSLPTIAGQAFGIRAHDGITRGSGVDVFALEVRKSSISGDIIVSGTELDFVASTVEIVGFEAIESFLTSAVQIELIISKLANSDLLDASFILYDLGGSAIHGATLDNINNVTNNPVRIYTDQAFTRPQFMAIDTNVPISEPVTLAIFGFGLAGLGIMRRRRRPA
jgi:hypothetical protein